MMDVLRRGLHLPPIVVSGDQAFCGSHRIAAYEQASRLRDRLDEAWELVPQSIPALTLSDEDYESACEYLGVEYLTEVRDCNEVAQAIYETTTDAAIRSAMEDQR